MSGMYLGGGGRVRGARTAGWGGDSGIARRRPPPAARAGARAGRPPARPPPPPKRPHDPLADVGRLLEFHEDVGADLVPHCEVARGAGRDVQPHGHAERGAHDAAHRLFVGRRLAQRVLDLRGQGGRGAGGRGAEGGAGVGWWGPAAWCAAAPLAGATGRPRECSGPHPTPRAPPHIDGQHCARVCWRQAVEGPGRRGREKEVGAGDQGRAGPAKRHASHPTPQTARRRTKQDGANGIEHAQRLVERRRVAPARAAGAVGHGREAQAERHDRVHDTSGGANSGRAGDGLQVWQLAHEELGAGWGEAGCGRGSASGTEHVACSTGPPPAQRAPTAVSPPSARPTAPLRLMGSPAGHRRSAPSPRPGRSTHRRAPRAPSLQPRAAPFCPSPCTRAPLLTCRPLKISTIAHTWSKQPSPGALPWFTQPQWAMYDIAVAATTVSGARGGGQRGEGGRQGCRGALCHRGPQPRGRCRTWRWRPRRCLRRGKGPGGEVHEGRTPCQAGALRCRSAAAGQEEAHDGPPLAASRQALLVA
jgi:hypothetical protein